MVLRVCVRRAFSTIAGVASDGPPFRAADRAALAVLVACAHSYLLVFAAGRIRVLRDMLAKFGEMGPKPLRPARPAIRDAEPQKMLRKRRRAWPR